MDSIKFRFISDPGHGWLEVSRILVDALGVSEQISSYSYQNGEKAYLEEDCDAVRFIKAFSSAFPEMKIEYDQVTHKVTPIRRYARFSV